MNKLKDNWFAMFVLILVFPFNSCTNTGKRPGRLRQSVYMFRRRSWTMGSICYSSFWHGEAGS